MILLEVLERSLCYDPNCIDCNRVPGLSDDAKEGLRLILDGELIAGPF